MKKLCICLALILCVLLIAACTSNNTEPVDVAYESTEEITPDPATDEPDEDDYQATIEPAYPLVGHTIILYTGNIRGNIDALPQVVALRYYYEAQGADVILVDVGNFLHGTIYATYDSGRTVIELMDRAGYDVVAIGSREFNFGTGRVGVEAHGIIFEDDSLGQLLEEASFQAVSANIVAGDDALHAFAPNTIVQTDAGVTVAFFGLTCTDTVNQVLEANLAGLTFQNPQEVLDTQIAYLADSDFVIGLSNTGMFLSLAGVGIIDIDQSTGLTVGIIVLDNNTNMIVQNYTLGLYAVPRAPRVQESVDVARANIQAEFAAVAVSEVVLEGSVAASRMGETNLGNLWTNALLWFALEGGIENFFDEDAIDAGITGIMVEPENVVAVWNGGNLRDFIYDGDVTMRDLQRVLPFPNRVAVMYLTGAQLLELLEAATQGLYYGGDHLPATASFPHVAGIEFTLDTTIPFDAGEPHGNHWFRANSLSRVTISGINGNAFDPYATYAIVTSNAIFNGMDSNYISLERCQYYSTITSAFVVDAVWMYVMQELGGIIDARYAAPQGRIIIQ